MHVCILVLSLALLLIRVDVLGQAIDSPGHSQQYSPHGHGQGQDVNHGNPAAGVDQYFDYEDLPRVLREGQQTLEGHGKVLSLPVEDDDVQTVRMQEHPPQYHQGDNGHQRVLHRDIEHEKELVRECHSL